MNVPQQIRNLLSRNYPQATLTVHELPSGNIWLDIHFEGTLFEIQYVPRSGFGISTIRGPGQEGELDGYGLGPDRHFLRFVDAKAHLESLLNRELRRGKKRPRNRPVRIQKVQSVSTK